MSEQEKRAVLNNISIIPEEELFRYIKDGNILLKEMMDTGNLQSDKRRQIEALIEEESQRDLRAWENAQSRNFKTSYLEYLNDFPNGRYVKFAKSEIEKLDIETAKVKDRNEKLLDKIRKNPNDGFNSHILKKEIESGSITYDDLIQINIPDAVVEKLKEPEGPIKYNLGVFPETIPDGFTEVYFWGVPGSGKTCALSGILSYAEKTGVLDTMTGPGFNYMTQLKNTFRSTVGILPPPTNLEVTQCLPFELKDHKQRKHPIALIELSGEIFKCFYREITNGQMPDSHAEKTYDTVKRFLNGPNKKLHYFVFDLSKDPGKLDDQGLGQNDYLQAAKSYFVKNEIFKRNTDGIYIVATKSDLLACTKEQRSAQAGEYLKVNYLSFVNVLKDVCKKYKINDGSSLIVIDFSLGNVYFNDICEFDNTSSASIVQILQTKSGISKGSSKLGDFFNK